MTIFEGTKPGQFLYNGPQYYLEGVMKFDPNGYLLMATLFEDTLIANTDTFYADNPDIFLSKLDIQTGQVVWAEVYGGPAIEIPKGLAISDQGDIYLMAEFRDSAYSVWGNDTLYSVGMKDLAITKLNPLGQVQWVTQIGGPQNEIGNDLGTDAKGNCYFGGHFEPPATIGGFRFYNAVSITHPDLLVGKLNPSGNIAPFASWHCRTFSPRYAHKAAHLLTVSEFSKQDIIAQYSLPPKKISVVYNGASAHFRPIPEDQKQEVRASFTDGQPYFLFVGAIQPRKNLENLLRGFDQFKSRSASPVKLLLVGRKGWKYDGAMQAYENMKHKDEVLFTGYVPDDQLNGIYGASLGLCYVPYFEGFGIPVLEAMYSETPVICSNTTSLPEVAGEAALSVDPMQPSEISHAMLRLWQEPGLRTALIDKGRDQRARFSWDTTYDKVWKVLKGFL
ncbi:glycosyltransferase [bacterium]|nr:glycosyltransferase [bacterium]